jgi:hypothetical protein
MGDHPDRIISTSQSPTYLPPVSAWWVIRPKRRSRQFADSVPHSRPEHICPVQECPPLREIGLPWREQSGHCSLAYSALACLKIGMAGSASFQCVKMQGERPALPGALTPRYTLSKPHSYDLSPHPLSPSNRGIALCSRRGILRSDRYPFRLRSTRREQQHGCKLRPGCRRRP